MIINASNENMERLLVKGLRCDGVNGFSEAFLEFTGTKPSGPFSNFHAKIMAIGNPTMTPTTMVVFSHAGKVSSRLTASVI